MAAIFKTNAVALRIAPYSNTSRIVVWLTEDGERLATIIKGALRPKSLFIGEYDLFNTSELLYYQRREDGLRIVRECSLLQDRPRFRADWRAYACASYLAHLVLTTCMDGQREPARARAVTELLDYLDARGGARRETLFWFELQWMGLLGLAPRLNSCSICGKEPSPGAGAACWSRHGVVCGLCAGLPDRSGGAAGTRLGIDVLSILRRWQLQPTVQVMATTQCSPRQLLEFDRILGTFLNYHIEHMPDSRRIALNLLCSRLGTKEHDNEAIHRFRPAAADRRLRTER